MVSEGSMPLTGKAAPAPRGAGGSAKEGESTSEWDRAGGCGFGAFRLESTQERKRSVDVTGGRRGRGVLGHMGK